MTRGRWRLWPLRLDFAEEPGAGMRPVVVGGAGGNAQGSGGLFQSHADKITKFYQFRFGPVLGGQFVERLVHGQKFVVIARRGQFSDSIHIHPLLSAAVTKSLFAAGIVNKDSAHSLGRRGKEMSAICKGRIVISQQTQPCFMHQRGGL